MTSTMHQPVRRSWTDRVATREMWGAVAIGFIWLAVLFDVIYGADFTSHGSDGTVTTIPSAVFVAFFAALATMAVARRAFDRRTGG